MVFKFKQFSVSHLRSAMKISTDSVLLGAWTPIDGSPDTILDIGAGTGILALMMAQRTDAFTIDAVEIDTDSYVECTENFENSSWADRLFCYHASFQDFVCEMAGEKYDLIISNPPFYTVDYKTENDSRNRARFEDALPFEILLEGVAVLLSEKGIFSLIIPFSEEEYFVQKASENGLYPQKITRVKGNPNTDIKRSLLTFSRQQVSCLPDLLVIENERHVYTDSYKELTKDFYLKK